MKKILLSVLSIFVAGIIMVAPVFADTKCVPTSVLGDSACDADGNFKHKIDRDHPVGENEVSCSCDDGEGGSIKEILKLVVDIMSIGVGILAVIGISVSGVQYLTAGGSEEKTRKAKRRILEIVIGLIAYVLIYALLRFLLPGFNGVKNM